MEPRIPYSFAVVFFAWTNILPTLSRKPLERHLLVHKHPHSIVVDGKAIQSRMNERGLGLAA